MCTGTLRQHIYFNWAVELRNVVEARLGVESYGILYSLDVYYAAKSNVAVVFTCLWHICD